MADIRITFKGVEYTIPENRAFAVGELVEGIATLAEVFSWASTPRYFKMARCLGAMLRFAGATVTDEQVHSELMALLKQHQSEELIGSIYMLVSVLMMGAPEASGSSDGEPEKPAAS